MELEYAVVGDAAIPIERSGYFDIVATCQEGPRETDVGNYFGKGPWLLCKELLHDQPPGCETDDNVCWKSRRLLGGAGNS